ncbi:hypothetical protein Acr_00g0073270 [Actinidia rufa]|uniref:Uncharacterized protein n=1 Tax=Actinidia rufa TaxID=165716 RepID=A0A7J0DS78_9ERIC|nr:hypothetical protein Acr_00g0073270 [Actinidia rufa]
MAELIQPPFLTMEEGASLLSAPLTASVRASLSLPFPSSLRSYQRLCALLPLTGVFCKVRHFASRRDSISPPLCAQLEKLPPLISSERDSFRRRRACRCASTLSLSSELLHGHPALVAPSRVWPDFCTYPKASPCAPVPLWILQVHPSGTPALALRASVQRLLLSSIHLANTTGPMSDSSSPVWIFSFSRYSLPIILLLQLLLFPLETLSVPPLASKLHRFDSCISMKHALPRSPSWISRLPCGTGLSFANNRVVSHPNKSLACYMCREHLSVSAQVVSNS